MRTDQDLRPHAHLQRKRHIDGSLDRITQTVVPRVRYNPDDSQPAIGVGRNNRKRRLRFDFG
jgi:hypothetical protein